MSDARLSCRSPQQRTLYVIRKVDVLEYPELGMEAIWKMEVEDFPERFLRSAVPRRRPTASHARCE